MDNQEKGTKDPHTVWRLFERHPDAFIKLHPGKRMVARRKGGATVRDPEPRYSFINPGEFGSIHDPYYECGISPECFQHLEKHGCIEQISATRWMRGDAKKPPPLP